MAEKVEQRSRSWCFTLNNYTVDDITHITHTFEQYVFQEETGENGTPHLQGVIWSKNAKTFKVIKKLFNNDKVHIEKCKNLPASKNYCSKKGTRTGEVYRNDDKENQIPEVKDPMDGLELKDWQIQINTILDEKPDDRKIYWFYEENGNVGKTTFAKHLCLTKPNCIYVSGKASDIKCAIAQLKIKPEIIIWDIPRSIDDQYISYEAIESIKNGIFFSGKYESGMVIYNIPHVIIFSNNEPNLTKLSEDRWEIFLI